MPKKPACDLGSAELFFEGDSDKSGKPSISREAKMNAAKELCGSCAVSAACLVYALDPQNGITHGIWGGKTTPERKRSKSLSRRSG